MNDFLTRAREINDETIEHRRHIHQIAEAGMDLPNTAAYVEKCLKEIGLEPKRLGSSGIVALIKGAKPGKTLLLRADMDALPMKEDNSLPFKSTTNAAHCCGHDLHTAMLLAAARMLSEKKDELCGTVKLMFQPGEENFSGSRMMIDAGLLESPKVDAAMAMHVMLDGPVGWLCYGENGMTSSCDGFKITVHGRGSHGAMPNLGVDPINSAVHIYQEFQGLIAREVAMLEPAVLTIGEFTAGSVPNIIPETAVMAGTLRTYDKKLRERLNARMREVAEYTAKALGASADFEVLSDVPTTVTDPAMLHEMLGYVDGLGYDFHKIPNYKVTPSDDFGSISEHVPCVYFMLCAKVDGNNFPHHNSKVLFSEDALPFGAAIHAQCAFNWLKNHAQEA